MNEDKFNQLCTDVEVMKSQLKGFINRIDKDMYGTNQDHEKRIRSIEDFKSKVVGAVAAAGVIGGVIGGVISFVAGKL